MKRGDHVLLKRGKKRKSVEVIHDHSADNPPFPALTIKNNGSEWIVGIHEIVTKEELEAERAAEKARQAEALADIVTAYAKGNDTIRAIASSLGKQMVDVLSKARKAERLGLIKLRRESK